MQRAWMTVMGMALVALVCALLAPLAMDRLPIEREPETRPVRDEGPDPMEQVADAFVRYRKRHGEWPCGWNGTSSSATSFVGFRCLDDAADLRDRWGRAFRVVFQAPTGRIPGSADGAIALVSMGPDGELQTPDSLALRGESAGDDQVRLIARGVR
jgi:hypothetical protein